MEVLNSADVIGEEIKEEARRKANLILKNADREIENLNRSTEKKIEKLKEEQTTIYKNKIEEYKQKVFVTIPLKKWKEKTAYIEDIISSSLDEYFANLSVNERLFIIKNSLRNFKDIVEGKELIVRYARFEKEKIEKLVLATFPNSKILELKEATYAERRFANVEEGVIIEDVERTFLCKAGLEQVKIKISAEIKEELFYALFGRALGE